MQVTSTAVSKLQAVNPERLSRRAPVAASYPTPRLFTIEQWLMASGFMDVIRTTLSSLHVGIILARGGQRDGLEAACRKLVEQGRQHGKHQRLAGVRARMRAIMQQEHIASAEPARQPLQHCRRVAPDRVKAPSGPRYVAQPAFCQHGIEKRTAEPRRRTEETRRPAGDPGNERVRRLHYAPQREHAIERKRAGMAITMVLDAVAATRDLPDGFGKGRSLLADTEKAGLGLIAVQQFEHPRRHFRVRAVVKGQRHFVTPDGACREASEIGPQPAPARPQRRSDQHEVIAGQHAEDPRPPRWLDRKRNRARGMQHHGAANDGRRAPAASHASRGNERDGRHGWPCVRVIRMAENARLRIAPMPTLEPMAFSTGTFENASTPKPITVEILANSNETSVRSRSWADAVWRSKNRE